MRLARQRRQDDEGPPRPVVVGQSERAQQITDPFGHEVFVTNVEPSRLPAITHGLEEWRHALLNEVQHAEAGPVGVQGTCEPISVEQCHRVEARDVLA